ncbi:MAG: dUTP diphosphatase [Pseudomonadota bacterium]
MEKIAIQIKRSPGCEDIPLPQYMTSHAAGMDMCAAVDSEVILLPGKRALIPTGISIALPHGFEAQIRPRSGLAVKYGIGLLNSPGTIDADYRGEIKIIMVNHGDTAFHIQRGDRIAQMVIHSVVQSTWTAVEALPETERNEGGFGHTGR